ncbi:hypothetical protein CCMSSC00406_0005617 [Pleurotus cornucopiae]|uniref:Uncharacterized protein n=1 Tax=Pleurotus cornucopiae TaxID=5321 RepID=A0ACB7IVG0_PLECO|nr:hypothetical protein CCMSSC00406_0005617 [Pleurotus cornucopiae]
MQFTAAFFVLAVAQCISAISLHPRQEGGCVAEACVATEFSGPVHCCPAVPDLIQPPYALPLPVPETPLKFGLDVSPSTLLARARPAAPVPNGQYVTFLSDISLALISFKITCAGDDHCCPTANGAHCQPSGELCGSL